MQNRELPASLAFAVALGALLLCACRGGGDPPAPAAAPAPAPAPRALDDARLLAAAAEPENWLLHGGTYLEQRYSTLTEINRNTISRLAPVWYLEFDTVRGQESTPLVADGVIYTTTAWSKVYAADAATGELIWHYDPQVPGAAGAMTCCDVNSRGPAIYEGKLFVATTDGRLIGLDLATGARLWSTVTVDQSKPYTITAAPRVVKNKVIIGNSGAEFGVRGYVSAYDTDTGALAWRFYTVPGNPADGPDGAASDEALATLALPTWFGQWWELGGGGTVWDAIVYDPELDQLYVGVGNGSPWNRNLRSEGRGDNLFLASVLALDPDTGEYIWHYQESPGDSWDFTATQPMILADLTIDGSERKVIMHAPKNGFFYVLDRETGRVISANNFVPTTWAAYVEVATGRPSIPQEAYYSDGPFYGAPTGAGAHNWSPMSYSPATGLVYFRARRVAQIFKTDPDFEAREYAFNTGLSFGPLTAEDLALIAANPLPSGAALLAWDPVAGLPAWQVEQGGSGVLATAGGLVLTGRGVITGELVAYDAETGGELWSYPTPNSMSSGPISYSVDGEQYIAITSGKQYFGGPDSLARARQPGRLVAFKLDGTAQLPPGPGPAGPANPPQDTWPQAVVSTGGQLYGLYCSRCHGGGTRSLNIIPDLRRAASLADPVRWNEIVLDGALTDGGMIGWSAFIDAAGSESIRAYVAEQARALEAQQ